MLTYPITPAEATVRDLKALLALLLLAPLLAHAQTNYPTRPVRILVTFPPGGSTDLIARLLSPVLAGEQSVPEITLNPFSWYQDHGITLHLNRKVVDVDRRRRVVVADDGTEAAYDRLFRIWFACGWPAFAAMLAILWLMTAKPTLG